MRFATIFNRFGVTILICSGLLTATVPVWAQSDASAVKWWKGNVHTHSLWSDGDDYPEMIVDWYKSHGYEFLALSDHNIMLEGEKWTTPDTNKGGKLAYDKYVKRFGKDGVVEREAGGKKQVRLKTLAEFRGQFEEPGKFQMIAGEELTDQFEKKPVHMGVSNLRYLIPPQHGTSMVDTLQRDVNAVLDQRKKTGQAMIVHVNHPNFGWALTAEDIMQIKGEKFMEVYNGHPVVNNYGDKLRASTERIWDVVLTRRLAELGLPPMWGTAVDDAHGYHSFDSHTSNPGRGWLMVKAKELKPEAIINALEAGDFYASSGVRLKDIHRATDKLSIEIEPEEGVTYTTQFIGTRKGYDASNEPVLDADGKPVDTTRRYSKDIGALLAEVAGNSASYSLKGDEIYVRAKVISSKDKENPYNAGDKEMAWVQPVVTGVK